MLEFRSLWDQAQTFEAFVASCTADNALLEGIYRIARLPEWARRPCPCREPSGSLLVIAEDWCGDASNTVPIMAKLGGRGAGPRAARHSARSSIPKLMDQYLTNGAAPIPIVIALDDGSGSLGTGAHARRCSRLGSWPTVARSRRPSCIRRCGSGTRVTVGRSTLREVLETAGIPVAKVA